MESQEYIINEFITLKLEDGYTLIYVAGERFLQCKFLMLNIPLEDVGSYDETSTINSVDEAVEMLDRSMEPLRNKKVFKYNIPPEQEFWGLCSNFEVWAENGYNTRILHSNLAFPLLRRLTQAGDLLAKKVFNQEIAERYNSGIESVREYLRSMKYLNYLSEKEFFNLLTDTDELDMILRLKEQLLRTDNLDIDIKKGRVIKIKLQAQRLKNVPEILRKFILLEHLILSYNKLEELPEWIGNFQKLKVLEVTDNLLKNLPESIGKLKSLEILRLRNNEIVVLPEAFGELLALRYLELYNNKITSIPENIDKLASLKLLDLHENELSALPEAIGRLRNLEKLRLFGNQLKNLPKTIGDLKNLKSLSLNDNNFTSLPESIGSLENLEVLTISNNPLDELPKSLYKLLKLEDLFVENTLLKKAQIKKDNFVSNFIKVFYLSIKDDKKKIGDY